MRVSAGRRQGKTTQATRQKPGQILSRYISGHWEDIPALTVNRAGSLLTRAVERLAGSAGFELLLGGSGRTLSGGVTVRSGRRHGCTRWWCGWGEVGRRRGTRRGWKSRGRSAECSRRMCPQLELVKRDKLPQRSRGEMAWVLGLKRRQKATNGRTWRHVSWTKREAKRPRASQAGGQTGKRAGGRAASGCASEV